ncbi:MAG TPA: hypothetical protein PLB70_06560, partial [Paludibacteraceae bacterium]|nr:hypothetical protein [Paludibacteraceae bacterium]
MKKTLLLICCCVLFTMAGAQNMVKVTLAGGTISSYPCSEVDSINFLSDNNFKISFNNGNAPIPFNGNATQIAFTKSKQNSPIKVVRVGGWYESGFIEWNEYNGIKDYNVYCKKADNSAYEKLDDELVRSYSSYLRADAMGLSAGNYQFKIVPIVEGKEQTDLSAESDIISVRAH